MDLMIDTDIMKNANVIWFSFQLAFLLLLPLQRTQVFLQIVAAIELKSS